MDQLHRFWFDQFPVRGELAQISEPWQRARERYDYPPAVQQLLGEAIAAATLLVATVKLKGQINIDLRSDGPVRMLVAQADSEGRVRGLARWDENTAPSMLSSGNASELCPNGRLIITIEPLEGQRYQGIVEINKLQLADVLADYFMQSEQLPTRFWLAADDDRVAGMMLQRMPGEGGRSVQGKVGDWEHVEILADTVKPEELLGDLPLTLLRKLFAGDDLRVAEEPKNISFRCFGCDLRVEQALRSLGRDELEGALAENDGQLEVECDFCTRVFNYDQSGVNTLLQSIDIPLQ